MKGFFLITLTISALLFLKSCKSYPMDNTHTNDMNRNTQDLQKRQEAEKNKIEPNALNDFGKPDNK